MRNQRSIKWLPVGYRVIETDADGAVECERGCGWKISIDTVTRLPQDARNQLFRNHDDWHFRQR
jgi:hypothetical protein